MSSTPGPPEDVHAKLLALADRFDALAAAELPEVSQGDEVWSPPPAQYLYLVRDKAVRDHRAAFDKAMKEAGKLVVALCNEGLIAEERLSVFVAGHELAAWGGLVKNPANLFALYVGGPHIELIDREGNFEEYETFGEGCPPQLRQIIPRGPRKTTARALEIPRLINQDQCRRYAAACRTLAECLASAPGQSASQPDTLPAPAATDPMAGPQHKPSPSAGAGEQEIQVNHKQGRRKEIERLYREFSQEKNSGGTSVYPSQEKLVEHLMNRFEVSRSTIMADLQELRARGKLPSGRKGRPKLLTNQMATINPTRSDSK